MQGSIDRGLIGSNNNRKILNSLCLIGDILGDTADTFPFGGQIHDQKYCYTYM